MSTRLHPYDALVWGLGRANDDRVMIFAVRGRNIWYRNADGAWAATNYLSKDGAVKGLLKMTRTLESLGWTEIRFPPRAVRVPVELLDVRVDAATLGRFVESALGLLD